MNKTQLNYVLTRVGIIKKQLKQHLYDLKNDREELSTEEKIGQILNGKARFKTERFTGGSCPSYADQMFNFFEFDGTDEISAFNSQLDKKFSKFEKRVLRAAERLEDDLVLGRFSDEKVAEKLEDFRLKWESDIERFAN